MTWSKIFQGNPFGPPRLTASGSRARVRELKKSGCYGGTHTLPDGIKVVLRKKGCRTENPTTNEMFDAAEAVLEAISAGYTPSHLRPVVEKISANLQEMSPRDQKIMLAALKPMKKVLGDVPGDHWPSNSELRRARERIRAR